MSQRLAERPEHHDSNSSFTAVGRRRAVTPGLRKKHWGERFLGATSPSPSAEIAAKTSFRVFPGGAVVENPPANAGDTGSSPGLGRSHMPRSN